MYLKILLICNYHCHTQKNDTTTHTKQTNNINKAPASQNANINNR